MCKTTMRDSHHLRLRALHLPHSERERRDFTRKTMKSTVGFSSQSEHGSRSWATKDETTLRACYDAIIGSPLVPGLTV